MDGKGGGGCVEMEGVGGRVGGRLVLWGEGGRVRKVRER